MNARLDEIRARATREIDNLQQESRRPLVRLLDHVFASDIEDPEDEVFDDELVEGAIGRGVMAVLYGDSNSGKTFVAVHMACSVALSRDWLGRRTVPGLVIYLATEAAASVRMRVRAYRRYFGGDMPGLVVVQSPINLYESDADVTALVALIAEIESEHGEKACLIVADTLARISAGANENSGEDMGVVLKRADALRAATQATVLWIHHCGKDAARGMRGWSGIRAAIDTELEVTADEATGLRSIEITKQRDLPGKGDRIGFRLEPVPIGRNRWGTARGSCVVLSSDAPAKAVRGKRPSEIEGAIVEFLTSRGAGCVKGSLVKHFEGRYVDSSVYREIKKLIRTGVLVESAGVVALPGKPGVNQ